MNKLVNLKCQSEDHTFASFTSKCLQLRLGENLMFQAWGEEKWPF